MTDKLTTHDSIILTPTELKSIIATAVASALQHHQPKPPGPTMTVAEAADELGIKPKNVRDRIYRGSIPEHIVRQHQKRGELRLDRAAFGRWFARPQTCRPHCVRVRASLESRATQRLSPASSGADGAR